MAWNIFKILLIALVVTQLVQSSSSKAASKSKLIEALKARLNNINGKIDSLAAKNTNKENKLSILEDKIIQADDKFSQTGAKLTFVEQKVDQKEEEIKQIKISIVPTTTTTPAPTTTTSPVPTTTTMPVPPTTTRIVPITTTTSEPTEPEDVLSALVRELQAQMAVMALLNSENEDKIAENDAKIIELERKIEHQLEFIKQEKEAKIVLQEKNLENEAKIADKEAEILKLQEKIQHQLESIKQVKDDFFVLHQKEILNEAKIAKYEEEIIGLHKFAQDTLDSLKNNEEKLRAEFLAETTLLKAKIIESENKLAAQERATMKLNGEITAKDAKINEMEEIIKSQLEFIKQEKDAYTILQEKNLENAAKISKNEEEIVILEKLVKDLQRSTDNSEQAELIASFLAETALLKAKITENEYKVAEQETEIMELKGETAAKDAKIIEMEKLEIAKENLLESRINESAALKAQNAENEKKNAEQEKEILKLKAEIQTHLNTSNSTNSTNCNVETILPDNEDLGNIWDIIFPFFKNGFVDEENKENKLENLLGLGDVESKEHIGNHENEILEDE